MKLAKQFFDFMKMYDKHFSLLIKLYDSHISINENAKKNVSKFCVLSKNTKIKVFYHKKSQSVSGSYHAYKLLSDVSHVQ